MTSSHLSGEGGEVGEGLCSSAVSTFALWHLGAPSVEAPSQEEDTNTWSPSTNMGCVHPPWEETGLQGQ